MPQKAVNNTTLIVCLILSIASAVCHVPVLHMRLNVYDEGIVLAGADRVLQGDVPYRDFWSMYPPGQFYTLAFLFKLFGTSVLVERIYDLAIRSLLALCGFLVTRKLGLSTGAAVAGWAMALVWTASTWFAAYPVYVALALIWMSLLLYLHYLENKQARWLFCSGLVMALGAAFRHDLGGMAALVLLVALVLEKAIGTEGRWRSLGAYLGGALSAGLPVVIYLIAAVGVGPLVDQLIVTPADVMPRYRWLPYPAFSFDALAFYLFPLTLGLGLGLSLVLIVRKKERDRFTYGLFVLSLTGLLFLNQVRVRSDEIHLFPAAMAGMLVLPGLVSFVLSSSSKAAKALALVLVLTASALFVGRAGDWIESLSGDDFVLSRRSAMGRAGFARMDPELKDVVSFIEDHTAENEAIYVGVKNHDQFTINDVIVPFVAGRPYATRYHELHPGVTTTLGVQQEIVQELETAPVGLIVLREDYWPEPNQTRVDGHVDLLDRYIAEHYALVEEFGPYELYRSSP